MNLNQNQNSFIVQVKIIHDKNKKEKKKEKKVTTGLETSLGLRNVDIKWVNTMHMRSNGKNNMGADTSCKALYIYVILQCSIV